MLIFARQPAKAVVCMQAQQTVKIQSSTTVTMVLLGSHLMSYDQFNSFVQCRLVCRVVLVLFGLQTLGLLMRHTTGVWMQSDCVGL